jgi:hypothetical protein
MMLVAAEVAGAIENFHGTGARNATPNFSFQKVAEKILGLGLCGL